MIKIYCIGKLKKEYKVIADDYLKRMKDVFVLEFKDEEKLHEKLKKEICRVYICDEKGKELNSNEFAKLLKEDCCFVIGSAEGFKKYPKGEKISFSKMTFTHQLFRLMLIEQIYRGKCILNGHPFPK